MLRQQRRRRNAQRTRIRHETRIGHDVALDPHLNLNTVTTQRIRAIRAVTRVFERPSIARMLEMFQDDRAIRRHARFPLRTITSSATIANATSGELLPPRSRPIGERILASSSSVNPSSRNMSRTATARFLLPSMPMYPTDDRSNWRSTGNSYL